MRSPPCQPLGRCLRLALPLLSLLLSLAALTGAAHDLANDDARALLAFRDAVGRHLPWNVTGGPCKWVGVSCDESGRVTALRLPGAWLSGRVPAGTLGNLTALRTLSLGGNRLSGHIPAALGSLTRLRTLLLESNRFVGEIPEMTLPVLEQFNVSFNPLIGSIPAELRSMPRSAFLGTRLCGKPMGPCRAGKASPSSAPGQPASPATTRTYYQAAGAKGGTQ